MGDIRLRGSPHWGRYPGQCKTAHLAPGDWQKEELQPEASQGQYLQEKIKSKQRKRSPLPTLGRYSRIC